MDTRTRREWSIQAHPEDIWWLTFTAGDKLITSGPKTLRFWSLPSQSSRLVAQLPAAAFNARFNAHGDLLLDGNDGNTVLITSRENSLVPIHKHDRVSYGVAWCGPLACSTGWDTNIICTNVQHKGFQATVTDVRSPTVWITSDGEHCYAAAASGEIYAVREGVQALYKHSREPYRLAVSQDAHFVISGDWDGNVLAYDVTTKNIVGRRNNLHVGLVSDIATLSNYVVTSGVDGYVRVLTTSLEDDRAWSLGSAIRYLAASNGRIVAALDDGTLWTESLHDDTHETFKTGTTLTSLAISDDGEMFVAGDADGELVIIEHHEKRYDVTSVRLERGRVSCAAIHGSDIIITCSPTGRVLEIPISDLRFQHQE